MSQFLGEHRAVLVGMLSLALAAASSACRAHPEELVESLADTRNQTRATPRESERYGSPLWEIDARVPFIGSPVHEQMTIASINLSAVHRRTYSLQYDEAYIHGVFWNDDPEDLLCPDCSVLQLKQFDKRWGIAFATRFQSAKGRAHGASGVPFGIGDGLLERSHFGDLQFIHGMATRDGEPARETQAKILAWAQFTYRVATGDIPHATPLGRVPIPVVSALFAGDPALASKTVAQIFKGARYVKRAAIGSLLHMIQDSYAPGHAEREVADVVASDGKQRFMRGRIRRFHSYVNQDPALHAEDDRWPAALDPANASMPGNPISVGATILRFLYANDGVGAPWSTVENYLRDDVFAIVDPAAYAGPGDKYRRR
jgi:hypothetical protein